MKMDRFCLAIKKMVNYCDVAMKNVCVGNGTVQKRVNIMCYGRDVLNCFLQIKTHTHTYIQNNNETSMAYLHLLHVHLLRLHHMLLLLLLLY